MFINNIPLRLKVIPHSCYNSVTRQDDVQSDVRTQLVQAVKHPYSIFQSLNVVSNDFSTIRATFQERDCVSCVGLNHVKKVQVAKYTHFRCYQFPLQLNTIEIN